MIIVPRRAQTGHNETDKNNLLLEADKPPELGTIEINYQSMEPINDPDVTMSTALPSALRSGIIVRAYLYR